LNRRCIIRDPVASRSKLPNVDDPVATAGIGVFTIHDHTSTQDYTIQQNTIVDPVVSAGGIVLHLDPPSSSYSTMKTFRIQDNHVVYTKYIRGNHASAVRLRTGNTVKQQEEISSMTSSFKIT